MTELREKIIKTSRELNELHRSWRLVDALMWSEEQWKEERERAKELKSQLQELADMQIVELETERKKLKEKFPRIGKKHFFYVPKKLADAEKLYNQLEKEINELKKFF